MVHMEPKKEADRCYLEAIVYKAVFGIKVFVLIRVGAMIGNLRNPFCLPPPAGWCPAAGLSESAACAKKALAATRAGEGGKGGT